jgi:hypothetical protein
MPSEEAIELFKKKQKEKEKAKPRHQLLDDRSVDEYNEKTDNLWSNDRRDRGYSSPDKGPADFEHHEARMVFVDPLKRQARAKVAQKEEEEKEDREMPDFELPGGTTLLDEKEESLSVTIAETVAKLEVIKGEVDQTDLMSIAHTKKVLEEVLADLQRAYQKLGK